MNPFSQASLPIPWTRSASLFVRTTSRIRAIFPLSLSSSTKLYLMDEVECREFLHDITKKNAFLRIRREADFYYRRIKALTGRTVVEVTLPGTPKEIRSQATLVADAAEQILLLTGSFALRRAAFHRLLGISSYPIDQIGLIRSADRMTLRSATKPSAIPSQVVVDLALSRRFQKYGFISLFEACIDNTSLARRLCHAVDWLIESRCEPRFEAALVKTSIALESLLIFSEREALSRSLSERVAFLLSNDAATRAVVCAAIKRFYDVRSSIVHGGKRRRSTTEEILDGVDKLITLVLLKIAVNRELFQTQDALQVWLDEERWRAPTKLEQSFPSSVVRSALNLTARRII